MNVLYICRVSDYQALGNQIDIPKNVAIDFFNVPKVCIEQSTNVSINICHVSDLQNFEMIEIQPATNVRFSTKLNTFLLNKGDNLSDGDLLVFEKLGRTFCVRCIKSDDTKYMSLVELFDEGEKHMLISATFNEGQNVFRKNKDSYQTSFSISSIIQYIKETGLLYTDNLIKRFAFSLMAKRFLILSGLAGSGKTQLALAFANALIEDEKQLCVVSVGADWTNREPLLGFPNALQANEYVKPESGVLDILLEANKEENKNKPYFLILDEMNMSYVERYFADFLSAMESGEGISLWNGESDVPAKISLPQNLFIIGTINVDETTYMFSPKVLDRANVIEFKISPEEMGEFLKEMKTVNRCSINGKAAGMGASFVELAGLKELDKDDEAIQALKEFFDELKKVNAEFGYRTATEIFRYIAQAKKNDDSEKKMTIDEIIDSAIIQKLLPKLHGSRKKLEPVLNQLWKQCFKKEERDAIQMERECIAKAKYKESADKIFRMYEAANANGFTSFAEA